MKKDQRVRNIMANPAENNVKNESPMQENKMGVMPVGKTALFHEPADYDFHAGAGALQRGGFHVCGAR